MPGRPRWLCRVAGTLKLLAQQNYILVYNVASDPMRVLRVLHAAKQEGQHGEGLRIACLIFQAYRKAPVRVVIPLMYVVCPRRVQLEVCVRRCPVALWRVCIEQATAYECCIVILG
ncbi:hypothetical protein LPH50_06905 [Xylella taiwanensis]|uniref:hypothetical protein n=1 Tax=Xylella taiwanensis TaxID=1444770 RepID=UPI001E4C7F80|nr:hypothetical protein [Xylella taiwanensis]MCD8455686.1 hypothetical protein [Xylella taiwanensis]MCD8458093.1 hypothetical protein [Xylella taiwanensis]MCD8463714.1 hypothetical protein [Xylella taiwanensis]MCD8464730.1 hypothetical protein [Xylella taiwanensis]MCD8467711.1 hypothetical protein [Xylella taiwanensis]